MIVTRSAVMGMDNFGTILTDVYPEEEDKDENYRAQKAFGGPIVPGRVRPSGPALP